MGNTRQVTLLLVGRSVPQQRAHDVHLGVRGRRIAAATVDLLQDDRGLGDAQSGAAVLGGNEHRQPASFSERLHEVCRVGVGAIQGTPVGIRVGDAQLAYGGADGVVLFRDAEVHWLQVPERELRGSCRPTARDYVSRSRVLAFSRSRVRAFARSRVLNVRAVAYQR